MTAKVDFETGNKRLLALATILETSDVVRDALGQPRYKQRAWQHECGTPACALGHWAGANPKTWFLDSERGIGRLDRNVGDTVFESAIYEFALDSEHEAIKLFGTTGCGGARTATEAATYIRNFVTERIAEKERTELEAAIAAAEKASAAARLVQEQVDKDKLGRRRLLELAIYLDRADELHALRDERSYNQNYFMHACGTPACALGHWAHENPARWEIRQDTGIRNGLEPRLIDTPFPSSASAFQDCEVEFNITPTESRDIFDAYGCDGARTGKEAAAYIRAFVARKWPELS